MEKDLIYIVPDIHGRDFYKPILQEKDNKVVFLGDYVDPYVLYENFTYDDVITVLKDVIEYKQNNPDNVTLLLGNHEFNYIWGRNYASRYNKKYQEAFGNLIIPNINLFEPYKIMDDVLFTHAGISYGWAGDKEDPIKTIDTDWDNFLGSNLGASFLSIFDCSEIRGGWDRYGGIFWSDLREFKKKNPVDYIQIFGHTQLGETGCIANLNQLVNLEGKPMYCIDSRAIFSFNPKTKELCRK